jgi:peptide/nickel transport system substrate-binding protein
MRTSRLSVRWKIASIPLLAVALLTAAPAAAQKKGGTLRLYHNDYRIGDAVHGRLQQSRGVRSFKSP